jgi:hypothetical protein
MVAPIAVFPMPAPGFGQGVDAIVNPRFGKLCVVLIVNGIHKFWTRTPAKDRSMGGARWGEAVIRGEMGSHLHSGCTGCGQCQAIFSLSALIDIMQRTSTGL